MVSQILWSQYNCLRFSHTSIMKNTSPCQFQYYIKSIRLSLESSAFVGQLLRVTLNVALDLLLDRYQQSLITILLKSINITIYQATFSLQQIMNGVVLSSLERGPIMRYLQPLLSWNVLQEYHQLHVHYDQILIRELRRSPKVSNA